MLNLSFMFDDANLAIEGYANCLAVAPLPATVYMMQMDVINHYRHALDHYFTLTLDEPFLQNSSLGTPYQKWAYFTNENFARLSFSIHNLLRYTSRLVHETACAAMNRGRRHQDAGRISNSYTIPLCEIKHSGKPIGIRVHDDHQLSITAIRGGPIREHVVMEWREGGPTGYFRVTGEAEGKDCKVPINKEEYTRIAEKIKAKTVDIRDRSTLTRIRERGQVELADLIERNRVFGETCNAFYRSQKVAQPFANLIESYCI